MTQTNNLASIYAQEMVHHPYGFAFYKPPEEPTIRPGAVGYIDDAGDWNPIAQLNDAESLEGKGYKPLREPLEPCPKEEQTHWGPKTSQGVRTSNIGLDTGAAFFENTQTPASIQAVYQYKTTTDFGAVLMTTPPIVKEGFYFESTFQQWVADNAVKILEKRKEVLKYGLWVSTATYTSRQCSLTCWQDQKEHVTIGYTSRIVNAGEAKLIQQPSNVYRGKVSLDTMKVKVNDDEGYQVVIERWGEPDEAPEKGDESD